MTSKFPIIAVVAGFLACMPLPALAQDLVYTPTNPDFGGNPFNTQGLAIANA